MSTDGHGLLLLPESKVSHHVRPDKTQDDGLL